MWAWMALAVVLPLGAIKSDSRFDYHFTLPKFDEWVFLGKYLAVHHQGETLATGAAGKLPFFSGLNCIDILGLNDYHIARTSAKNSLPGHGRFDTEYVFNRKPDLIGEYIFADGDLAWDLPRNVYEAHGYRLTYLVRNVSGAGDIIIKLDEKANRASVRRLIKAGYSFGVVTRVR